MLSAGSSLGHGTVASTELIGLKTWEDPSYIDPSSTYPGDGDPLDVCELAGDVAQAGQVKQVKALGAFAVIEDQKADWKVVVVDVGNPLAEKMTNINDVDKHLPGYLDTMLEWFRVYRMAEGKVKNAIGGDDGRDETRVIKGREYVLFPTGNVTVYQTRADGQIRALADREMS